jgi:hypothetical protein
MHIDNTLTPKDLSLALEQFFALAGPKIRRLQKTWGPAQGTPVITRNGRYTTRGWTEWTQGFQYGCQLLQFDATSDEAFLVLGRRNTVERMATHVSHTGVHDHGFNNVSTYGALLRLAGEGRIAESEDALQFHALALKVSGAVQANRWTRVADGSGFIHSFNGPHSLFVDTVRTCRVLLLADRLGHTLMAEGDAKISLLDRAMQHLRNTARFSIFYGEGRDVYDLRGRTAHECLFDTANGAYRCPGTQQGYAPFSTWTRGLAWAILGFAETLEYFDALPKKAWASYAPREDFPALLQRAAQATADFYLEHTPLDGIPYWDTGAPGLARMGDYLNRPAQPDNPHEPVDSSAAAIAAQGLLRLGHTLGKRAGLRYTQAGLSVARTLFAAPYLAENPRHDGLLLHSVYHRPNGWDHIPKGKHVPFGESSLWGDYHAMELAVYLQRLVQQSTYLDFFSHIPPR